MNLNKIIPLAILSIYRYVNNRWADDNSSHGFNLSPVVVTPTRSEQNSFDIPVSIDVVDAEQIQEGRLQSSISESLARVPGLVAASRGQSAQDVQISSRGFGARSAFGVRGVRLYADGIPLTMPDGQGQAGTFDLGTAKSIEVMRGPFSALYGNSSGGVVQILTADGSTEPTVKGSYTTGSYGTNREAVNLSGTEGIFNYNVGYSHLESDGYRPQSAVRKDLFNAKIGIQFSESTKLTILVTDYDQPVSQDPGGLTKAEFGANPRQTTIKAITFDTKVAKSQSQAGFKLDHIFDENNQANAMVYFGERDNLQYQSVGANVLADPPSSSVKLRSNGQTSTLASGTALTLKGINYWPGLTNGTAGAVAQISRDFWGTDLRFTHKGSFANGPYSITIGTNFDTMTDARTGYDNFTLINGTTVPSNTTGAFSGLPSPNTVKNSTSLVYRCGVEVNCGAKGMLRRNEDNTAWNFDQYAQTEWSPTSKLKLLAGLRHSNVHLKSQDYYLDNGNGSGSVGFSKTTPVIGALFKLTDSINLYANAGQGFETPSLVEMAYLPFGSGGFNTTLKPATSNNYEIGAKAFITDNTRATIAIFKTKTNNEIVVADNTNGRSSYQNAGGTERNGVEISLDSNLGNGFNAFASYAYLDAKYTSAFCSGSTRTTKTNCEETNPSVTPNAPYGTWINSEKSIPGAYRQTAYAEINWKHISSGFSTALEARIVGKVGVDDKTDETAAGYGLVNWRGGFAQKINKWNFSQFVRIENIFERNYVGSVKVNESSKQYYEPGAGRNWLLGINASYNF